jgi:hypothetical protein
VAVQSRLLLASQRVAFDAMEMDCQPFTSAADASQTLRLVPGFNEGMIPEVAFEVNSKNAFMFDFYCTGEREAVMGKDGISSSGIYNDMKLLSRQFYVLARVVFDMSKSSKPEVRDLTARSIHRSLE